MPGPLLRKDGRGDCHAPSRRGTCCSARSKALGPRCGDKKEGNQTLSGQSGASPATKVERTVGYPRLCLHDVLSRPQVDREAAVKTGCVVLGERLSAGGFDPLRSRFACHTPSISSPVDGSTDLCEAVAPVLTTWLRRLAQYFPVGERTVLRVFPSVSSTSVFHDECSTLTPNPRNSSGSALPDL